MGGPGIITREATVWCSRCNHWQQEGIASLQQFQKDMRTQGWVVRKGLWVCPNCLWNEKKKKKPAEPKRTGTGMCICHAAQDCTGWHTVQCDEQR